MLPLTACSATARLPELPDTAAQTRALNPATHRAEPTQALLDLDLSSLCISDTKDVVHETAVFAAGTCDNRSLFSQTAYAPVDIGRELELFHNHLSEQPAHTYTSAFLPVPQSDLFTPTLPPPSNNNYHKLFGATPLSHDDLKLIDEFLDSGRQTAPSDTSPFLIDLPSVNSSRPRRIARPSAASASPPPSSCSTASSSYPSSSSRRELISRRRRNDQVPSTPVPRLRTNRWKCPYCSYVQHSRRSPDLKRHVATHTRPGECAPLWVCCGVPLVDASVYGVPADVMFEEEIFEFRGLSMVGGCRRTFSRRDAFNRHLRREEGVCFGDVNALYQPGNTL